MTSVTADTMQNSDVENNMEEVVLILKEEMTMPPEGLEAGVEDNISNLENRVDFVNDQNQDSKDDILSATEDKELIVESQFPSSTEPTETVVEIKNLHINEKPSIDESNDIEKSAAFDSNKSQDVESNQYSRPLKRIRKIIFDVTNMTYEEYCARHYSIEMDHYRNNLINMINHRSQLLNQTQLSQRMAYGNLQMPPPFTTMHPSMMYNNPSIQYSQPHLHQMVVQPQPGIPSGHHGVISTGGINPAEHGVMHSVQPNLQTSVPLSQPLQQHAYY